jgi:mediator of RNA polymerase II transcription subunit 14
VQLFDNETAKLRMNAMTGIFTMLPQVRVVLEVQRKLNASPRPAEDGPGMLEALRYYSITKDLTSRGKSIGWSIVKQPISTEEVKNTIHPVSGPNREPFSTIWLRRAGWGPQWFVMISLSLTGDQWWLVEA